jgi:hypothetical protein
MSQHPCRGLVVAGVQYHERFHTDRRPIVMQMPHRYVDSIQALADQILFVAGWNNNDNRIDRGAAHNRSFPVGPGTHTHAGQLHNQLMRPHRARPVQPVPDWA